ncbi:hypothetical protein QQF64_022547 [Cirrhinus molitorella]|uniref:Uncharacterized protein n=1 Tax=Cirrhinus molitorella TaxID=172907 RepID=A0ABR3L4V5_9TELE
MACKRRQTRGPCVPAEQRCASLSVTCKAFIGFIYLAASGRRIRFSPALIVLTLCLKMLMAIQSAQVLQPRSDVRKSLQTCAHTHPELSRYSSLTFDPDFTSQTKACPPSFSLPLLYLEWLTQ